MEEIALTIDDKDIVVDSGTTILEAALQNGIYIPHLCYHPDLKPTGACRLCIVELGNGRLVTSCRMPVEQGMVVRTRSPEVDKVRRTIVELLVADHHASCRGCAASGHCELQKVMAYIHIDRKRVQRLRPPKTELPQDTSNPFFDYDPNKCVLCGICVSTCEQVQGALHFVGRGYNTKIVFLGDSSICESCGECGRRCPVGALMVKGN